MNEQKKILIVEDEKDISEILSYNIQRQGYAIDTAYDGETGLSKALTGEFDLILLDVMLPKMDGFEICRRVREKLQTPIIILTAREEETDKIMGLDLGADDYMTKPFSIGELTSRIKANIRRYSGEMKNLVGADNSDGSVIKIGELVIDTENVSVKKSGKEISLSKKEYDLLSFLAKNKGSKFPQDKLLESVWGYGDYYDLRTVDVTVRRLRQKIEDDASSPKYILNMRSVGYYIAEE
ncbi:MAG: response regulator transcription factor [Clostridia bacterium]|nr:response regulator transcription factor [Clostridia bacterium]